MPFVTKYESQPPKVHWGEPRGSVRAFKESVDGIYGAYVIEQPAGKVTLKMCRKMDRVEWSHEVFLPWRYFAIRVRWDGRVDLSNCGVVFFAKDRVENIDECGVLFSAILPNVFEQGNICSGYGSIRDRSPVRAAWRAVRKFYEIPGNQWIHGKVVPNVIIAAAEFDGTKCFDHHFSYQASPDFICRWSTLSQQDIASITWDGCAYGCTVKNIADLVLTRGDYQNLREFSDNDVDKILKVHEGGRSS